MRGLFYFLVYIVPCSIFFLCSCESELAQYETQKERLRELREISENKQKEYLYLLEQQKKAWETTAKERFADLHTFRENEVIPLLFDSNIKEVVFQHKKNNYQVFLTLHRTKSILPKSEFTVYLMNELGLILGQSKKISKNKKEVLEGSISFTEPILSPGTPVYFRVETCLP